MKAENGFEDEHPIVSTKKRAGTHDGRVYQPLESTIDQLDRFFDPFRTDPRFLDWLARWVALELRPDWTTAEKRRMIARMVRAVKRVGLKAGLYDFLDIYATEKFRPRIAIDDDEALFRLVLKSDGSASVNVLAYASLDVWDSVNVKVPFLYRPTAIAVQTHNDPAQVRYLVASAGRSTDTYPPQPAPSLWLLKPNGELDDLHWKGALSVRGPVPSPINIEKGDDKNRQLSEPVAVAFHPDTSDYLVLERGEKYGSNITVSPSVLRYPKGKLNSTIGADGRSLLIDLGKDALAADPADKVTYPVDMVVDAPAKRLIVLDRRNKPACLRMVTLAGAPKLVTVPLDALLVVDPTAIARETNDTFVITDARDFRWDKGKPRDKQKAPSPGTLIRVKLTQQGAVSEQKDILKDCKDNPLVYPTGLVVLKPGTFLVCDTGVKLNFAESDAFRTKAEPAAVFRVEVPEDAANPPSFTLLTPRGMLCSPSRIARDEQSDAVLVTDAGELEYDESAYRWRGQANKFAVSVLYSIPRLDDSILDSPPSEQKRKEVDSLNSANRGIEMVIDRMKPLHASPIWNPSRRRGK